MCLSSTVFPKVRSADQLWPARIFQKGHNKLLRDQTCTKTADNILSLYGLQAALMVRQKMSCFDGLRNTDLASVSGLVV